MEVKLRAHCRQHPAAHQTPRFSRRLIKLPRGVVGGILVLLVAAAVGTTAQAVSELGFAETMQREVWPYYESGAFGSFMGADSVRITYAVFAAAGEQGALVILPGKSESFIKYAEMIYDLRGCGYTLYLMDHRGMGFSGRLLGQDVDKVHVGRFDDYVRDLEAFVQQVVKPQRHAPCVVLGHSMGATVALRFLETYPEIFDRAILCAPMLQIITDPWPEPLAFGLSGTACLLGQGDAYCPGEEPWDPGAFADNTYTHSRPRWSLWQKKLIPSNPVIGVGGVTMRWLRESLKATAKARELAEEVRVPVLLLQAGEDALVKPEGQNEACAQMTDCRRHVYPGARHEILMERDAIRDDALERIRDFLVR